MKTSIVTLQYGKRAYFNVSLDALKSYSKYHGYNLVVAGSENFKDNRDLRWSKVPAIMRELANSELVLYLDADAMLVDPKRPLSELLPLFDGNSLLVGEDIPGNVNTGVILCLRDAYEMLTLWNSVPENHPETATTWPVDELGFNKYVLPVWKDIITIASKRKTGNSDADFLFGTFVQHFPNGDEHKKAEKLAKLVNSWKVV